MEIGDKVQLKGGCQLIVVEKVKENEVTCIWFYKGDIAERVFDILCLEPYKSPFNEDGSVRK